MNTTRVNRRRGARNLKLGCHDTVSFILGPSCETGVLKGTSFTSAHSLENRRRFYRGKQCLVGDLKKDRVQVISAKYLSSSLLDVDFTQQVRSGNFGRVFFGFYTMEGGDNQDVPIEVVVKCPVNSDIGRKLYDMERYTNFKLGGTKFSTSRFPNLLGEVIIPADVTLSPGLLRLGLVWERCGDGNTLEDYLSSGRIAELATALGTTSGASPLRRQLSAKILKELALIVQDLQKSGIVHRDIKPENCLIVSPQTTATATATSPIQVIDFGSSCDWNSMTKKGLGLATCDPIYTAPEKRLNVFKPAFRFDVYSIGLIALRVALPSITDVREFERFVTTVMERGRSSFERVCVAVENGRIPVSQGLRSDIAALCTPAYEDMYAALVTMLTAEPADRADVSDCLRSRFVQSADYY